MQPAPRVMYRSPNNAATGKQIALPSPKARKRAARRAFGPIVPHLVTAPHAASTRSAAQPGAPWGPLTRRRAGPAPAGHQRSARASLPEAARPETGVSSRGPQPPEHHRHDGREADDDERHRPDEHRRPRPVHLLN